MVISRRGCTIFDITKPNSKVPNASRFYEYFPPKKRVEPEPATLPDIFGNDCRISSRNDNEMQTDARELSGNVEDPSDLSPRNNREEGPDMDATLSPEGQELLRPLVNSIERHFGMSADDSDESEDYYDDEARRELFHPYIDAFESYFINRNRANSDVDSDQSDDDDYDSYDGENSHGHGALNGLSASNLAFDRALHDRPNDPDPFGHQHEPPNYHGSEFPILHFSETTIHLMSHALDPQMAVVCRVPLRQRFSSPFSAGSEPCDRFNLVKYIPENGLVVAASQKGRALVLALTRFEDKMFFRVDSIVPFKDQEKHGERPLRPLLGMAVSPMQGFEMQPDVPYIPSNASALRRLAFKYMVLGNGNDDDDSEGSDSDDYDVDDSSHPIYNDEQSEVTMKDVESSPLRTLPEYHAEASRVRRANESRRSWYSSRRYRLFLLYDDQTVMSYEFWYSRKGSRSTTSHGDSGDESV